MESTLAPGDSFVVILSLVAGDIEESNVVIFEAQVLHGDGLTTHRVDGGIGEGYAIRGDANTFIDHHTQIVTKA